MIRSLKVLFYQALLLVALFVAGGVAQAHIQLDSTTRSNKIAQINATIGGAPNLLLYSGAQPTNTTSSSPSGLLVNITLPTTWLTAPSSGVVSINGTWSGTAIGNGTAASFRIYDSGGSCRMQGNVSATSGGGDVQLDNPIIVSGQSILITGFTLTEGNP